MSLNSHRMQVSIPVSDMARARQFYSEKFGIAPVHEHAFAVIFDFQGTHLSLVPSQDAGKASYSLVTWMVDEIDAAMSALRATGIVFAEYDFGVIKTINGKALIDGDYVAWFKDSEGNLLAIAQVQR